MPFGNSALSESAQNALVIRVQPDEGLTLKLGAKVPGTSMQVRDVTMDFAYGHAFTEDSPEAYERLILDALVGSAPLFPHQREVEASWKILDPILSFWETQASPSPTRRARGVPSPRTTCWPETAVSGGSRDHHPEEHHIRRGGVAHRGAARRARFRRPQPRPDAADLAFPT